MYLAQWSMRGRVMKLRGRATDAADVRLVLTNEPNYLGVTSRQANVRLPDGLEQFTLDVQVGEGDSG